MSKLYCIVLVLLLFSSCRKTEDINNNILRLYGDALEDIGYSIARADDGYVIAGQLTEVVRSEPNRIDVASSRKKMGIIKTNNNGDVIWQKSVGDQAAAVGSKAIVLEDGSVVCVGYSIDEGAQYKNLFIVKTDNQGNPVIQKTLRAPDGKSNQYGIDILKTSAGFLVLGATDAEDVGASNNSGNVAGKKDILLIRLSNDLVESGSWAAGYPGNDEGVSIKEDIGGGFIISATTDRSDKDVTLQKGYNILLIQVNSNGIYIRQSIIGNVPDEYASDIEVLDDGYLVVSTAGVEGQDQKGYVWRLSENIFAEPVYEHPIEIESSPGTKISFVINAVTGYKTSSFVMAGQSGSGSSAKMLIFLTDGEGNLLPGKSVITGGTGSQSVNDVISDENGNIYAVGKNSYESNSMISLLKFRF